MPSLSTFAQPAPYHILSFSILLGSTFYQSFLGGPLAFRALARPQFSVLQQHIFPVFFLLQTVLPVFLLLSHPAGPANLLSSTVPGNLANHADAAQDLRYAAISIMVMFFSGFTNWLFIGPATVRTMKLRKALETREGVGREKREGDEKENGKGKGEVSPEMRALNQRFGVLHGVSTLVNLGGMGAMVAYTGVLGEAVTGGWGGKP